MTKSLNQKTDYRRSGSSHGQVSNEEIILPLALEVGRIGVFQTDFERKRTNLSPELCSLLGFPVDTVLSYADASEIFHEEDRARVQAAAEKALHAPDLGHWSVECRVRRADGTVRWVAISGRRIYRRTRSGLKPIRSIGTVVDITALKETERALRDSEQRLRLALEAAGMGTFEVDIAATEARIDVQQARLLGLPEETRVVPVELLRERIPGADLQASDEKRELMDEGNAYHHEFRLRMPGGSTRWLSAHADFKADRILGVSFDITHRKLTEEALALKEARLRAATDAAALGVFEWDPLTDEILWGNDQIFKIFGKSPVDGPVNRARFVDEYLHPHDKLEFDTVLEKAIRTRAAFRISCRIKPPHRSRWRWLEIQAQYERAAHERPGRFAGIVADITARTQLEQRSRRLSQRLLKVQEAERSSIARELHDSTVQHLVATSLIQRSVSLRYGAAVEDALGPAESELQEAMKELRAFSYLLHPPALEQHGLYQTMDEYVAGFARRSGLLCTLRMDRKRTKYKMLVQRSVLRIVQEGLTNAYRHASASKVSIDIRCIKACLHVVVSDNGQDTQGQQSKNLLSRAGVGLHGLRMRLRQLRGKLRVSSDPMRGTMLHAALPVKAPGHAC